PLQRRALIGSHALQPQRLRVEPEVVLRVGRRTLDHLRQLVAGRLRGVLQDRQGVGDAATLDQLDHPAHLHRRVPDETSPRDSRRQLFCRGRVRWGVHRCFQSLLAPTRLAVVLDVTLEGPGRGELAQLVPDHRLGDEHRDVLATVVHRDGVAQHVRDDRGPARPGLDHRLLARLVQRVHLLEQVVVHERALLQAAWHGLLLPALLATLAGLTATDDEPVGRLAPTGTTLRLAVRVHRVTATGGAALTTTVRVVDRVHHDTTDGRALALPPGPACLTPVDVGVLGVADLADRGAVAHVHVADLAGRHTQLGVRTLLGDQLDACASRPGDLRAAARTQLDGVHHGADRDVAQRQVVARLDVRGRAGLHHIALLELVRRDDVALLAVGVVQQRDASRPVRVVLDVRDLGRHAVLVVAPEVDQPVRPLVTATLVPGG